MEYLNPEEKRILESYFDPAIVVDGDGVIRYWNRAFPALLGVRPKRLEEDPDVHSWLNLFGLKRTLAKAATGMKTIRLREVHGTLPDGSPCSVFLSVTPLENGDGSFRAALVLLKDLTGEEQVHRKYKRLWEREKNARLHLARVTHDLRSSHRTVQILNSTLVESVRERSSTLDGMMEEMKGVGERRKEDYLSSVSHELRSPITSIQSMSEILLRYRDLDPEKYEEFIEIIHSESRRLSRLVDDILDLSKLEAGAFSAKMAEIEPTGLVEEVIRSIRPLADEKGIIIRTAMRDSQPSLESDADRLKQVLMNLLSNSIKFTEPGGTIEVSLIWLNSSDMIQFNVKDSGLGIPPEELSTVFDRYHQVGKGEKGGPKGTGLGLSICKMIVENLGGVIWAQSEKGEGATFSFRIPRQNAKVTA